MTDIEKVKKAIDVVARLRGPKGCPWDRAQNHLTLRQYLIEEAHEVLTILDRYQSQQDPKALSEKTPHDKWVPADGKFSQEDGKNLREELGDLLLQVLLHAQLCAEREEFNFGDVCNAMAEKLIARHPHVFGDVKVSGSDEVLKNWESLKKKEGRKGGLLAGLPKSLPSLQRASRIGEKARHVGFDWPDVSGVWAKVNEELEELKEAFDRKKNDEIEHELGDLFFSLSNFARHLGFDPESVHRKAIERFESRFEKLENHFTRLGKEMNKATLEELDAVWEQVKKD